MTITVPNRIEPNTPASADQVDQNYQTMLAQINANLLDKQGSLAMTGHLTLVGDPMAAKHAATMQYVDAVMPVGVILAYGGESAPAGGNWAMCNGASLTVAQYPKLHQVIGERYGSSGTGTFTLPNLQGRVLISATVVAGRFDATGKSGGSWLVPIPSHTHTINHDHGVITSANQSANHTHSIDHNHAVATTSEAPDHSHQFSYTADAETAGAGTGARINGYVTTGLHGNIGPGGSHAHTLDLPTFDGTSGNNSAAHTHAVNMPNYTGTSGATDLEIVIDSTPTVVKTTTEHIPPYVVIQYIIRLD